MKGRKIDIIAGMILGIAIAFACSTTADSVAKALDIIFDNDGTSLSAKNVQDAIKELDTNHQSLSETVATVTGVTDSLVVLPKVYDANNNLLGIWAGMSNDREDLVVYNAQAKGQLIINAAGNDLSIDTSSLYFSSSDCSGQAYVFSPFMIGLNNNKLYRGKIATATNVTSNSYLDDGVSCVTASGSGVIMFQAENVSSLFSLPLALPLSIQN